MRTLTIEFVNQKRIASINVDAIESIILDKENNEINIRFIGGLTNVTIQHDSLFQAQEKYKVLTYFLHGNQKSKKIYVWDK